MFYSRVSYSSTFYTREQIKKSLNALLPSHVASGPEQLEHICKKNAIFPLMIEPNKRTGPHYAIHTYLPTYILAKKLGAKNAWKFLQIRQCIHLRYTYYKGHRNINLITTLHPIHLNQWIGLEKQNKILKENLSYCQVTLVKHTKHTTNSRIKVIW